MKILITGNMGYVGPVVVKHLRSNLQGCYLAGFDTGYFAHCLTNTNRIPEGYCDIQYFGDMRNLPENLLKEVDGVVHLAAISNDPMGNKLLVRRIDTKALLPSERCLLIISLSYVS